MVNGIDVSDFQPDVHWSLVHEAGYSFAYCKATEGVGWIAQTFDSNWGGLKTANMLRGAYHMFRFDQDPIQQAKHFLNVIKPTTGDLPPAVDLELTVGYAADEAVANIAKFLGAVEAVTHVRCVLYLGYYFWKDALASTTGFSGHPLWLAQYSEDAQPKVIPSAWSTWTLWQYSEKLPVNGTGGAVDANRFNGNLDDLGALSL
jgi:lysozyme